MVDHHLTSSVPGHAAARSLASFKRDQKGGVASLIGLSIVPIALALGLAVDGGLAYTAHNKLQSAIDAAALAAARVASTDGADVRADARMFFDANYPGDYLGGQLNRFNPVYNEETGEVTIDAEVEIPTTFMQIAGKTSVTVGARAAARQQLSGLELSLVLDTTGSMGKLDPSGGTKIQALKDASETLLDIIYGEEDTVDDVSVAVVPYTTAVNLGSDRTGLLSGFDADAFGSFGWGGCVEARSGGDDRDDTPPSQAPYTAYAFPVGDPNTLCTENEVLPLTEEKSIIADHVDALIAYGGTINNIGLSWGWRTISPRWRGEWGSSAAPVDYDHKTIKKAIIFMTDGETDLTAVDYSAYGELRDNRLGTSNQNNAEREIDDRMLETCALAKQEGVEIYTITFAPGDAEVERNFRACATSDEHYFDAPDGDELETAFREIAGQLTSLRLTQ